MGPPSRFGVRLAHASLAAFLWVAACDQTDQDLPFTLDPLIVSRQTIGPLGGRISHALGFSMEIPPGALVDSTEITVVVSEDLNAFPGSVPGELLPESHFEILPPDLELLKPALVSLNLRGDELDEDQTLRLGLVTVLPDGPFVEPQITVDLTSEILTGPLSRLGSVAAIVSNDVVVIVAEEPPPLTGGLFTFGFPSPPAAGSVGPFSAAEDTLAFAVSCGNTREEPTCFEAEATSMFASEELSSRLSPRLILLSPRVDAALEFSDFQDGLPTRVEGHLSLTGTLRIILGQGVTSFFVDDIFVTGANNFEQISGVSFDGPNLIIAETSVGSARSALYELRIIDDELVLIMRGDKTVDLENADGSITTGTISVDLKLRL